MDQITGEGEREGEREIVRLREVCFWLITDSDPARFSESLPKEDVSRNVGTVTRRRYSKLEVLILEPPGVLLSNAVKH